MELQSSCWGSRRSSSYCSGKRNASFEKRKRKDKRWLRLEALMWRAVRSARIDTVRALPLRQPRVALDRASVTAVRSKSGRARQPRVPGSILARRQGRQREKNEQRDARERHERSALQAAHPARLARAAPHAPGRVHRDARVADSTPRAASSGRARLPRVAPSDAPIAQKIDKE